MIRYCECGKVLIDNGRCWKCHVENKRVNEWKTPRERYLKYISSAHWKHLSNKKIVESKAKCEVCEDNPSIVVHHVNYRNLFDCTLDDLQVLCDPCHNKFHGKLKKKSGRVTKEILSLEGRR